ncbi:DNA-binding response OmpR family regulator [Pseudonocardia eucalypti]|uniref:winged helix-turn-helix domain-containing protein n=1 Tax=Pseudonocardia eucalypti TaxID=648755 RepID=UPI001621B730|nr:DNA-binding response OmpR family regulator [Pseudonocardia eucalypti]
MRVLLIGYLEREIRTLTNELARFRVQVLQTENRDHAYLLLEKIDAIILGPSSSLPDNRHDFTICRAIRARSDVPIVALAVDVETGERILGLRTGVDDYVCRPYRAGTLVARIESIHRLRTRQLEPSGALRIDDVVVNLHNRSVTVAGNAIKLSRKEFQILELLATECGGVCAKETLYTQVWGNSSPINRDTLYVHIATLRSKLGRPVIETVRGEGYRLIFPADTTSPR